MNILTNTASKRPAAVMADVQTRVQIPNDAVGPTKAAESQITSVAASAGVAAEPVLVEGRLGAPKINARVTGEPVLGPAQFFPANPTMAKELAENKPVKQMSDGDRTSSGGILRTISDVITELRSKHQNRKRVCPNTCLVSFDLPIDLEGSHARHPRAAARMSARAT